MTRGDVYWADLVPRSGSEQTGRRPVIIVSHDSFNQTPSWRSVIVVPVSTSGRQRRGLTAIELPAAIAEKLLPSASLACTINGTNYVNAKSFVSLEATWKNNHRLDAGFYPGSGFQIPGDADSGAIRGRLEVGDRELGLQFTARFANGSDELTKLEALTEGTAVVQLSHDANNDLTLTYQRVTFSVVELGDTDGIVTVQVTVLPMKHAQNGLFTAVAKCNTDDIAQAEAA